MPTNIDIADDLIGYAVNLNRFSAAERSFSLKVLRQLERDLTKEIRVVDPTGATRTAYQQKRLETLLKQTRVTIRNAYGSISRKVDKDMIELAELSSESVTGIVNGAVKFDVMTTAVPPSLLRRIGTDTLIQGSKSSDWWARQAGDTRFRFENAMRDGVLRGETVGQLQKRARDVMPVSRRNAEGLARTVVVNVSNEAALETFKENDDVIEAVEWLSTLDSRTTPICRALDGLKWTLDYEPIGHSKVWPGPTAHWACRSTQIPVLYEADKLPPRKAKGANKVGKRASKDGPVSADLDYDSWLKRRPKSEQLSTLGTWRFNQWKTGKFTQRDFTDSLNRPLTFAQFKAKYLKPKPKPRPKPKPKPVPKPKPKPKADPFDTPKPPETRLTQAEIGRKRATELTAPADRLNGPAMLAHYRSIGAMPSLAGNKTKALAAKVDELNKAAMEKARKPNGFVDPDILNSQIKEIEVVRKELEDSKSAWKGDVDEVWSEMFGTGEAAARKQAASHITKFSIGKRNGSFAVRDKARDDVSAFSQMFGAWLPDSLRNVKKQSRRAWAHKRKQIIDIGSGRRTTVFHEIGHHVEFSDPGVETAAHAFRASKATADKTRPLRTITGNPGYSFKEKALPGDFLDPYVGKVYSDGATEVVSMGVEQFESKERLERFAYNHPEHFEFMLGLIRSIRYR